MTTRQNFALLVGWAKAIAARTSADESGEVTEKVIIVAIFAALALAIGAIIVLKVTAKANSIPTS
jgi:hypothetical protein